MGVDPTATAAEDVGGRGDAHLLAGGYIEEGGGCGCRGGGRGEEGGGGMLFGLFGLDDDEDDEDDEDDDADDEDCWVLGRWCWCWC